MSELKPCPFCGGAASIQTDVRYPGRSNGRKSFEVLCSNPDCVIYRADNKYFFTKKDAVAAWNKRAEQPIVRCEHCFFYGRDQEEARRLEIPIEEYCALHQVGFPKDGFCSYGKPRGGGINGD